jgi:hypothetical protein
MWNFEKDHYTDTQMACAKRNVQIPKCNDGAERTSELSVVHSD